MTTIGGIDKIALYDYTMGSQLCQLHDGVMDMSTNHLVGQMSVGQVVLDQMTWNHPLIGRCRN
jgi:hypothetical protein